MKYLKKISCMGVIAASLLCLPQLRATALTPDLTVAQELTVRNGLAPRYKPLAVDSVHLASVTTPAALEHDGSYFGTVNESVTTYSSFWQSDTSNDLSILVHDSVNDDWRTYAIAGLAATYNTAATIDITHVETNGDSSTNADKLVLTLTDVAATGGSVTKAEIIAFLKGSVTYDLSSAAAGGTAATIAPGSVALKPGGNWTMAAIFTNISTDATAGYLSRVSMTLTAQVTDQNNNASTFIANISDMVSWNTTTTEKTVKAINFTYNGNIFKFNVIPAKILRTDTLANGLRTAVFPSLINRRIAQAAVDTDSRMAASLTSTVTDLANKLKNSPGTASVQDIIIEIAKKACESASMVNGDYPTFDSGNAATKHGLFAIASANLTNVVWSQDDTKLIATAEVGTIGYAKQFVSDLAVELPGAKLTAGAIATDFVTLTAADGDAIIFRFFGTTALDGTVGGTLSGTTALTALASIMVDYFKNTITMTGITKLELLELMGKVNT